MKRLFSLLLIAVLVLPSFVFAKISINEIAWMGTTDSANNEWIELANDGGEPVVLDGWTLESVDGTPKISLKGTIVAGGYFLLERTSDATVPTVVADLIYTGAMSNDGEVLVLKDAGQAEISRVDGSNGWKISGDNVAGNNTTKETAQFSVSSWITATGTPRSANALPPSNDNSNGTNDTATTTDSNNTEETASQNLTGSTGSSSRSWYFSSHSSSAGASVAKEEMKYEVNAGRKRVAAVGTPIQFRATDPFTQNSPAVENFTWTFGDGSIGSGKEISHTYFFPGDYVVILNATHGPEEAVSRTEVKIIEPKLFFTKTDSEAIGIKNNSAYEINLHKWQLASSDLVFVFPLDTIIPAGREVFFPSEITKILPDKILRLSNPAAKIVLEKDLTPFAGKLASNSVATSRVNSDTLKIASLTETVAKLRYEADALAARLSPKIQEVENKNDVADDSSLAEAGFSDEKLVEPNRSGELASVLSAVSNVQVSDKAEASSNKPGILRRVLSAPLRAWNLLKQIF